jgi:hypothetical protein
VVNGNTDKDSVAYVHVLFPSLPGKGGGSLYFGESQQTMTIFFFFRNLDSISLCSC